MFFQDAFLDTPFCDVLLVLWENGWFWKPFKIQRSPKSADTGRCQALSNKEFRWPRWIMTGSSKSSFGLVLAPEFCFFDLLVRFLPAPQNIEKPSLPKSITISKNHTLDAKGFNFGGFLMPFGSSFLIVFPDHLDLLICNKYNAVFFFTILGLPFGHQNSISKSCFSFCKSPFLEVLFLIDFKKFVDLGTPSKSSGRQHGT